MRWIWIVPVMLLVGTVQSFADEAERLSNAATVLQELRATPDKDVPAELWEKAACVGVIPSVKKAAFMFGGEYGRGVMSCRQSGRWSVPMFLSLEKGSWGFQAGAESIDLGTGLHESRGRGQAAREQGLAGRRRVRGGGAGWPLGARRHRRADEGADPVGTRAHRASLPA